VRRKFIVNPASGRGATLKSLPGLKQKFERELGIFDYELSNNRRDLEERTRSALLRGYEQIVAVGGDGTINAVVNGFFQNDTLVNPQARLVVSQSGSGSDYFRSLTKGNPRPWTTLVEHHAVREVDLGKITYPNGEPPIRFVNMASLGMTAGIIETRDRWAAYLPPLLSYALPTVFEAFRYRAQSIQLDFDGSEVAAEFLVLLVGKGEFVGNGMKIGNPVSLDDGKLGVVLIKAMTGGERLVRLPKLFANGFNADNLILKKTVRSLQLRTKNRLAIEFDGDIGGMTNSDTNLKIEVEPAALRLCVPVGK
jgi:diacylglycerol kinase (ATP)